MPWRPLGLAIFTLCQAESNDTLSILQSKIQEELHRIRIATFAAENAAANETEQVRLFNESERLFSECGPRYTLAEAKTTQAKGHVSKLEASINQTRVDLAGVEAKVQKAKAFEQKERLIEEEVKREAWASQSKADVILPQDDAWVVGGMHIFVGWLSGLPCQNLIAALVGALGVAGFLNSELFLEACSAVLVALGAGVAAGAKFLSSWGDEPLLLSILVGIEAAFLAAAAVFVGFAGFQLLIGAVTGLLVAQIFVTWAAGWCPGVPFWYLIFLAMGVAATGIDDKTALAVLGYAAAGFMLSSCMVFFLAEFFTATELPASWVDSVDAFINGDQPEQKLGEMAFIIRSAGFLLWFVTVAFGKKCSAWFRKKLEEPRGQQLRDYLEPLLDGI
eukprot:symbB.v1.2.011808.t1/scaffold773.1/size166002/17